MDTCLQIYQFINSLLHIGKDTSKMNFSLSTYYLRHNYKW